MAEWQLYRLPFTLSLTKGSTGLGTAMLGGERTNLHVD